VVNSYFRTWHVSHTLVVGGNVQEGAQGVIDDLVLLAACRYDVV
jgi:hypothetical protein